MSGPYWTKYGWKIARDFGMPFHTETDQRGVWNALDSLESYNQAGDVSKLSRWFSWNYMAEKRLREFNAEKMILEFSLDSSIPDPDTSASFSDIEKAATAKSQMQQLSLLKASAGGLKLCYMLMSSGLQRVCRIMRIVTAAIWSWYTDQVTRVKNALRGLIELQRLCNGAWCRCKFLYNMIDDSLYDAENIEYMEISGAVCSREEKHLMLGQLLDLLVHILHQRLRKQQQLSFCFRW
jgi:hypothetical protein